MEVRQDMPNKKHVFVCTNKRDERACCDKVGGFEVFRELKQWVRDNDLARDVWVTKTGCLGFCNDVGTTIVVYPDKKWFLQVALSDVDRIKEFVLEGLS